MFDIFASLDLHTKISLILALTFILTYEFINGFHDTANAVATVVYTKAMPPNLAVMLSGIFNFLGVLLGGVGVAYTIIHILPVELVVSVNGPSGLMMIFSMLLAAITWNLGTWYLGIPTSSSHTLIGSIIGVSIANSYVAKIPIKDGFNWEIVTDIGLSLIASPIIGFVLAGSIFLCLKKLNPLSKIHNTPKQRKLTTSKKRPPFWNRLVLVISAMGVSFVHGSNDGQKGIGLIMLTLICIVPSKFVLNLDSTSYQIGRTCNAVVHMKEFCLKNKNFLEIENKLNTDFNKKNKKIFKYDSISIFNRLNIVEDTLKNVIKYDVLPVKKRIEIRKHLLYLDDTVRNIIKIKNLPLQERMDLEKLRSDLTITTEYAPLWVIISVALSIGLGTMVGWRRVASTIGEKIGKEGMTYAQGAAAQATTVGAIGLANIMSLPVSTTHVLSSGIAGTMVANKKGLQMKTIRHILLAWIITLPAAITLSYTIFWLLITKII
ncbi:Low-affinity inorganic phosphate transporter 1 [Candidatus Kinetoplastibacterium sorsogonicusi]|uniref:Phosphate transporter n=1 Tax=Candidatus Kinetoplastidibacterium kentomonadis TaxID=1576550 RepID=A0A3S7J9C2_9PROT|nr:inorganic phosphate transporter [Candidatus Kinetoplastibacterium sorsogonicusi]AWD32266.1 Low-affinity inorganic phosphate transporter 1 [Candidatus Kinetoplastibacterium sorsogonicusi]